MSNFETSKRPTIHLESKTLNTLEQYRQGLALTGHGLLNYDRVIALLLKDVKTKHKENK